MVEKSDDQKLVEVLDLVDEIVLLKQALSTAMSSGYMDIATERYNNRAALMGLSRFMYDERSIETRLHVDENLDFVLETGMASNDYGQGLRSRKETPSVAESEKAESVIESPGGGVLLSPSLKSAASAFRSAVEISLQLVRVNKKLDEAIPSIS